MSTCGPITSSQQQSNCRSLCSHRPISNTRSKRAASIAASTASSSTSTNNYTMHHHIVLVGLLSLLLPTTGQALHMVRDSYRRPLTVVAAMPPSTAPAADAIGDAAAAATTTAISAAAAAAAENSRDYVVDMDNADDYADTFVDAADGRNYAGVEEAAVLAPHQRVMPLVPAFQRQMLQQQQARAQHTKAHRMSLQSLFESIGNGDINRLRSFPAAANAPHLMEIRIEPPQSKRQSLGGSSTHTVEQRQRIQQQRQRKQQLQQFQLQRRQERLLAAVHDASSAAGQRSRTRGDAHVYEPASGRNILSDAINSNSKRASTSAAAHAWQRTGGSAESASLGAGGGGGGGKSMSLKPPQILPSIASQLMLRSSRGQRNYDVPQIGE